MISRVHLKVPITVSLLLVLTSAAQAKPKWRVLFDGQSTVQWRGFRRDTFPAKCWQIEKGSIKTVVGCDKSDQVDIVTREKRDESIMPEGLVANITPAELASLLAFLESTRAK